MDSHIGHQEACLPTYSPEDDNSLHTRIQNVSGINLPILRAPSRDADLAEYAHLHLSDEDFADMQVRTLQRDVVEALFSAVKAGQDDIVTDLVSRGYVAPDATNSRGETPLNAAVRANKLPMVSRLVALGADVNAFGKIHAEDASRYVRGSKSQPVERTPLQVAAEQGNLALVRVLKEDYNADDAIVSPDGALALRLAAINGHREIVAYLPSRRGGEWRRWETANAKEMRRVRRALKGIFTFISTIVWHVPKLLLFHIPKEVGKALWQCRHKIMGWCKKQIKAVPTRLKRGVKGIVKCVKRIPETLKSLLKEIWHFLKAIPGVVKDITRWIGRGLATAGRALLRVMERLVSFLHTFTVAIVSFFRKITLQNVWEGFVQLLRAIFIEIPRALASFAKTFGKMVYKVLGDLFGVLGKCVWYLGAGIWFLVCFIPKNLWAVACALGRSTGRGYEEAMACFNPKRM